MPRPASTRLPAGAALRPTGDIAERFTADPRGSGQWFASGTWSWDRQATTLASGGVGAGTFIWNPGSHFTGRLALRLRLLEGQGGAESRGRLIFAHDAVRGAHRWLEIVAGNPGRLTLGQTGTIGAAAPGVLQSWRTPVAAGAWLDVALRIAADRTVTVSLAGKDLFTAAAAPLAPGKVGFASVAGAVEFDQFSFTADPDGEPCVECHAGEFSKPKGADIYPQGADVYAWWDGRRWDTGTGGDPLLQQGGHGDPGGEPAVGCTGTNGCHDLRQPRPEDHRNGTHEGRGHRSVNSFHLRQAAIVVDPVNPWDAQITIDTFCSQQCHNALAIGRNHRHGDYPVVGAVQLGQGGTRMTGETLPIPVDSDVTTRATPVAPDYAPCISCHDPHGTGAPDNNKASNRMLRMEWTNDLCRVCHT